MPYGFLFLSIWCQVGMAFSIHDKFYFLAIFNALMAIACAYKAGREWRQ